MGKSFCVPVLCPYGVPGLETHILGLCRLLAWSRNGNSPPQGGYIPTGAAGGDGGTWDGLRGRSHPVPRAGLGGAATGAKELQPPARSPLPGVSHKGQFCLLKWVVFCFGEWARSGPEPAALFPLSAEELWPVPSQPPPCILKQHPLRGKKTNTTCLFEEGVDGLQSVLQNRGCSC